MSIPKYNELMLPILKLFADGKEHHRRDFDDILAKDFEVSDEDLQVKIKTGDSQFVSRVIWAMAFLKQSFLIEATRRGVYIITSRGKELLNKNLSEINTDILLKSYPDLMETKFWNSNLRQPSMKNQTIEINPINNFDQNHSESTPEDLIDSAYTKLRELLKTDLLDQVKKSSPIFFEKLVVDLLAKKGVFITTSSFAQNATEYAKNIEYSIVLIDGEKLTDYMIDFGIGVSVKQTIEIKRLDADYFDEE